MADEKTIYAFTFKEVAEALIKRQGLHEGIWGIFVEFGIGAGNVPIIPDDPKRLFPAAIVPIQRIGLQNMPEISSISVDAAEVNPLKKT